MERVVYVATTNTAGEGGFPFAVCSTLEKARAACGSDLKWDNEGTSAASSSVEYFEIREFTVDSMD